MKDEYINHINQLRSDINLIMAQRYENRLDNQLTTKQVLILELIKAGIGSAKVLADKLKVSTSAVSQLLSKLEDRGYLERSINPGNRREIMLKLTGKALQYFDGLDELKQEMNKSLYGKLSGEELKQLKDILEKLQTFASEEG